MNKVYEPDLDLFVERATQISHRSVSFSPIKTLSNLQNVDSTIVEFEVPATDNYVDFKKSDVMLKIKIQKNDGGTLSNFKSADDGDLIPANYLLHACIERVEVELGPSRVPVSPTDNLYGLCAYIDALLNYGSDAKKSHLTQALYYKDAFGGATAVTNSTGKARGKLFEEGREVWLRAPLHSNLWQQPKPLLSNTGCRIKLHLKSSDYVLQKINKATLTHSYVYKVTDAVFSACLVKPTPGVALAHEENLRHATAKYPVLQTQVTHHTISQGSSNFSYQNLFASQVPDQLIFAMFDADNFEGTQAKNCFYIEHAKISSLKLTLDGHVYPVEEMKFDFDKDDYLDGYHSIFSATGVFSQDVGLDLSREEYKKGFSLFCFDLSHSGQGANNSIQDVKKTGDLSVDIHFASALQQTTVLVAIGNFKGTIEITKNREIIKDFR